MGIKKFKESLDVIRSIFGNEVYITQFLNPRRDVVHL